MTKENNSPGEENQNDSSSPKENDQIQSYPNEENNDEQQAENDAADKFHIEVGLVNAKGERRVVFSFQNHSWEDLFDVSKSKKRDEFIDGVSQFFNIERDLLVYLHEAIPKKGDEFDEMASKLREEFYQFEEHEAQLGNGRNKAKKLVDLVENIELFHDPHGETYATFQVEEHFETANLKSPHFKDWLLGCFYKQENTAPRGTDITEAMGVIEAKARYDGESQDVFLRVAESNGNVYIDLTDEKWRVVEITPDGWKILNRSPVKFRRARGMLALPLPEKNGSLSEFRKFVNIGTDEDWALICSVIIGALQPNGPFPILAIHGQQGSAKSTTMKMLRMLIDPNEAMLRSKPREERDLVIAASNGWFIALDNLSFISEDLSDALCRMTTTGGFATRKLYSDSAEKIFSAKRPVLINGINELIIRSDLLDRAIIVNLPPIEAKQRQSEKELFSRFHEAHPRILGAIFSAVAEALKKRSAMEPPKVLPRMADFLLWVIAAEGGLDIPAGSFMNAYNKNREEIHLLALEASLLLEPLRRLALEVLPDLKCWSGTATNLKYVLEDLLPNNTHLPKNWPGSPSSLSNRLKRIQTHLPEIGIHVEFLRQNNVSRTRCIKLSFDSKKF